MILVNFKAYESGTGKRGVEMAGICRQAERVSGVSVLPVVQGLDLYRVSKEVEWDWAWCQHADGIDYGAHTGWMLPEGIKQSGANGVVLNHAERKFENIDDLKLAVDRCRSVGLSVGICANDLEAVKEMVELRPDWVAYEPPELIGSSEVSVSSAKPEVVKAAVEVCSHAGIKLLIGAGIHSANDVRVGLELGASGFLLASAVMKSEDPGETLRELLAGYE